MSTELINNNTTELVRKLSFRIKLYYGWKATNNIFADLHDRL